MNPSSDTSNEKLDNAATVAVKLFEQVLAEIDAETQRCRDAVAACPKWSPAQAEWSRARDACLNIRDRIQHLQETSK